TDAPVAADAQPKRRRLPGVNLRPGTVKQARIDSGMSLAQLGKGHVTAPAIYLIETGRTRPSLPTLEHIARRTNRPLEFFLAEPAGAPDETQASLIELEALVADGRNQDAIALGMSLLDRGTSGFRLGRIRYLLAQAYLATAQPERAAPLLTDARAHFEAVNDGVMLAECMGAQAMLANMTQSRDALARSENNLALVLMTRGDVSEARRHLDRSLELCDEADLEFGRSHVLLSLCELSMQEGNVDQASGLAQQALVLAERLEEGASI